MKVRLPLVTPESLIPNITERIERFDIREENETVFLDGPVCERVAVLDFEDASGELHAGVPLQPPKPGRKIGEYRLRDSEDFRARDFNAVAVFATVMKTLHMVEEPDALGRRVPWGFDGSQLLVVPRAGLRANAFYERASHSLQFFFFPSLRPEHKGRNVFTSLYQDIVAHETGHAILDGIAPDLHHAQTPQALALHEAVADLIATIMSLRTRQLASAVLQKTRGEIEQLTALNCMAEEFAQAQDPTGRRNYLRTLNNRKTLNPEDASRDAEGQRNRVRRTDPHLLCQVLTGALYPAMLTLFQHYRDHFQAQLERSSVAVSGKALAVAANHFKRLTLRGLDYLPPGEVSFADYARALLASDQAAYPQESLPIRDALVRELVCRHVVPNAQALAVDTNFNHRAAANLNLTRLVESDWYAYDFANREREFLGIPRDVEFEIRQRLDVTKVYHVPGGKVSLRECIFKVSWEQDESVQCSLGNLPKSRKITVGTTLALSWEENNPPRVRVLLRGDAADRGSLLAEEQHQDRNALLEWLIAEERLRLEDVKNSGLESDRHRLRLEISGESLRVKNVGNLLHVADGRPKLSGEELERRHSSQDPPRLVPPPGVDAGAFFNLVKHRRSH